MALLNELRFLVVDDMLTMRKIVSKQLKDLGVTAITEADDGSTAWKALEESVTKNAKLQFIVSDWNMPIMKGLDLLKKCRSDERFKDVAFLMVTAEAEVAQVKEAIVAGVDNYVVKPFTPDAFRDKLNMVFKKRFPG